MPNAAPMGLHRKGKRLFARIYNSKTLENIINKPELAANIVDDPVLFVQSSLSDLEHERFEFVEGFPVIKNALAWIIFECKCKKGEKLTIVQLYPIKGEINSKRIKPVNRGFNAVIEASIHATRYMSLKKNKYLDCIKYYNSITQKCGSAREQEAMRLLYKLTGIK